MIKLTKEDKFMIVTLILVLAFVLVFLSVEILDKFQQTSKISDKSIQTNPLDSLYSTLSSLSKNEDSANLRRALNEIFELMNEKEYDKLHELLSDDFKKMYYPNVSDLKKQIDETFNNENFYPSFLNYEKFGNTYVVKVSYIPKNVTNADIASQEISTISDTFSINIMDDGSYTFSFEGYIGCNSPNTKRGDTKVSIELSKVYLYTSKTIFEVKIHNNTDKNLVIGNKKISCTVGFKDVYYPSTVSIPKNSSKTINFIIYTGLSLSISLPTHITFEEIITDEKVYMGNLPITYPIDF